jgi:hypothetical protein
MDKPLFYPVNFEQFTIGPGQDFLPTAGQPDLSQSASRLPGLNWALVLILQKATDSV